MTKQVRIENADMNTSVEVVVVTEDLQPDGSWKEAEREVLGYPTSMSKPYTYLTSTRRLVVIEQPAAPK